MHRTIATLRRHPPHRMKDDPEAPGTCLVCHIADDPAKPRNQMHDEEAVAAHEAKLAEQQELSQRRTGER